MGAGASFHADGADLEIFRDLKEAYESKKAELGSKHENDESDRVTFDHIKQEFITLTNSSNKTRADRLAESKYSTSSKKTLDDKPSTLIDKKKPVPGDIVQLIANANGEIVEGIILESVVEEYNVEIDGGCIIEGVTLDKFEKVIGWETLEVSDIVKVKEDRTPLYFQGEILRENQDGTYDIMYEEDEIEESVDANRILKVFSGRSVRAYYHWQSARKIITAASFFF